MPKFGDIPEPDQNGNGKNGKHIGKEIADIRAKHERALKKVEKDKGTALPPKVTEPRCHACTSEYRNYIERSIMQGHSYLSIERSLPETDRVDRRSISHHAGEHMTITPAAYRAILEEEAVVEGQNTEGVKGVITMRGIMEIAARQGFEAILKGDVIVEPKDLIQIAKLKAEMDANHAQIQVDEYTRQFTIFTQAIQNVIPPDMQATLVKEIQRLRKREEIPAEYERAIAQPVIEAKAIEDGPS